MNANLCGEYCKLLSTDFPELAPYNYKIHLNLAVVVCEPLTAPVNGDLEVMGSMFMSEAVYTCDFGFNLSTGGVSFTRVCQNTAVWSGVVPTCICKLTD